MKVSMMALAVAGVLASAGASHAQTVIALMDDNVLAPVDAKTMAVGAPMTVSGVEGKLVGIDVRSADGQLYGLFEDGTVAVINTQTGAATVKSKLDSMLPAGTRATVDFNPVADRLRVIGDDGMNLRANVDDGKVTVDGKLNYAETDANKGTTPEIVAGAYTNSVKGAKETALYNIDAGTGMLVKQAPPNDGVLTGVGELGVDASNYAFDIVVTQAPASEGWLYANGTAYRVDLATGAATEIGKVSGSDGTVLDIAVLPSM